MALKAFGFIFTGPNLDPAVDRARIQRDDFRAVMVGVAQPLQAIAVARELVAEGIELIELCGGFGPVWTAKVIEAIEGCVPVGSVGYGPESIAGMARLFPPEVAPK
jgi:hypothetical protein